MSTVGFLLLLGVVVAACLVGLVVMTSLIYGEIGAFVQARRGFPSDVVCPRSGHTTRVRIGRAGGGLGLRVLSCERFPDDTLRCQAECFPALARDTASAG